MANRGYAQVTDMQAGPPGLIRLTVHLVIYADIPDRSIHVRVDCGIGDNLSTLNAKLNAELEIRAAERGLPFNAATDTFNIIGLPTFR